MRSEIIDFAFYKLDPYLDDKPTSQGTPIRRRLFKKLTSKDSIQAATELRHVLYRVFTTDIRGDITEYLKSKNSSRNRFIVKMLLLTLPEVYEVILSSDIEAKPYYTAKDIAQAFNVGANEISRTLNEFERKSKDGVLRKLPGNKILRLKKGYDMGATRQRYAWSIQLEYHPEDSRVDFAIFALPRGNSVEELLRHHKAAVVRDLLRQWKPKSVVVETRRENVAEIFLLRGGGAMLYRFFLCDGDVAIVAENKSIPLNIAFS